MNLNGDRFLDCLLDVKLFDFLVKVARFDVGVVENVLKHVFHDVSRRIVDLIGFYELIYKTMHFLSETNTLVGCNLFQLLQDIGVLNLLCTH